MWCVWANGIEERRERGRNAAGEEVGGKEWIEKGGKRERIDSKENQKGVERLVRLWGGEERRNRMSSEGGEEF